MLALTIVALPCTAWSQEAQTGADLRKQAVELSKQNRLEQALPLVAELTIAHPNDAGLQEMLGACLLAHAVNVIAQDYNSYRNDHRDQLILYLNEYVVPAKK